MTASSDPAPCDVIVITGMSGSGKSVALRALEDSGWYCVDNLPASAMSGVVDTLRASGLTRVALSIDARNRSTLESLPAVLDALRERGIDARLMLLDATDQELLRRFGETRRPHPFATEGMGLEESVRAERQLLRALSDRARRIDTTSLRPNDLRAEIKAFASSDPSRLHLFICSFGFKHGVPQDADFVFDVRFLPNPFYDPALRALDGRDAAVAAFIAAQPMTPRILADLQGLIEGWLPAFVADHRSVLTIAIGCTGGQHRSVYLAEQLAQRLQLGHPVRVIHRSLGA